MRAAVLSVAGFLVLHAFTTNLLGEYNPFPFSVLEALFYFTTRLTPNKPPSDDVSSSSYREVKEEKQENGEKQKKKNQ